MCFIIANVLRYQNLMSLQFIMGSRWNQRLRMCYKRLWKRTPSTSLACLAVFNARVWFYEDHVRPDTVCVCPCIRWSERFFYFNKLLWGLCSRLCRDKVIFGCAYVALGLRPCLTQNLVLCSWNRCEKWFTWGWKTRDCIQSFVWHKCWVYHQFQDTRTT